MMTSGEQTITIFRMNAYCVTSVQKAAAVRKYRCKHISDLGCDFQEESTAMWVVR